MKRTLASKNAELRKRIRQLEAKVVELESRPVQHIHNHYYPAANVFSPRPTFEPTITCASVSGVNVPGTMLS